MKRQKKRLKRSVREGIRRATGGGAPLIPYPDEDKEDEDDACQTVFETKIECERLGDGEEICKETKHPHCSTATTLEPMTITSDTLAEIMPYAKQSIIDQYTPVINEQIAIYGINKTPLRVAHFLAQIAYESASFNILVEHMDYGARELRAIFPSVFPTDALAKAYARQPERIANRLYANTLGNGDEKSGDGWRYRGRGLIPLTGKERYLACSRDLGFQVHDNVLWYQGGNKQQGGRWVEVSVQVSVWLWDHLGLNPYADEDDIVGLTRRIDSQLTDVEDRAILLRRAKDMLGIW